MDANKGRSLKTQKITSKETKWELMIKKPYFIVYFIVNNCYSIVIILDLK